MGKGWVGRSGTKNNSDAFLHGDGGWGWFW